jgi:septal ring factor EnvC (AmiA/AmiB activator)
MAQGTGVGTEVCCGEDYRVQDKLAWIREKNAELSLKLKEVETSPASREKGNPKFTQMRDKLKSAIQKMNDSAKALTTSTAKNRDAAVAARGDIHPGVIVEICRVPF